MRRLAIGLLKIAYLVYPVLSVGSLLWYFFGDIGISGFVLFWAFGFAGMFAGGWAKHLEGAAQRSFVFRAGDPVSRAMAAFHEVAARNEIPGLDQLKDEVLAQIQDRERTAVSLDEKKMDPRGLVYLLISNVASQELCTGRYHVYRGRLSMVGQQMWQAFTTASRRLVEYGVQTQAEHESDVERLRQELASIG